MQLQNHGFISDPCIYGFQFCSLDPDVTLCRYGAQGYKSTLLSSILGASMLFLSLISLVLAQTETSPQPVTVAASVLPSAYSNVDVAGLPALLTDSEPSSTQGSLNYVFVASNSTITTQIAVSSAVGNATAPSAQSSALINSTSSSQEILENSAAHNALGAGMLALLLLC